MTPDQETFLIFLALFAAGCVLACLLWGGGEHRG